MAFAEDLTPFFQTSEFAHEAALTPAAGGPPIAGVVIYDENGEIAEDFGVSTVGPACIFPAEQWPDADEADLLDITFDMPVGPRSYRVRSKVSLHDGKIAVLALVRA